MLIGLIGKPNAGKSTFFSASTLVDVAIANYPFTTIEPNKGITYVRVNCACKELKVTCKPNNSKCENGIRLIPIATLDVAGLVPGAHTGKGLGNKFLDDLRNADALIQVVDVSGTTDEEGKESTSYDPAKEIVFLENEIVEWTAGIIRRAWSKVKGGNRESLISLLTGLGIKKEHVEIAINQSYLTSENINWSDGDILLFSKKIREIAKPIIIAANKVDLPKSQENIEKLRKDFPNKIIYPCYAEGELALRKANEKKLIRYTPGDPDFEVIDKSMAEKQVMALGFIRNLMKRYGSTGVQEVINNAVFKQLNLIVVYPVEDENKYTNNFGAVLPDAHLIQQGSTALDLAAKIHSDLAKHFIFAVDAKNKMRVGKDYKLKNGDVIKIIAGKGE
ncbi:redox-regulated ATPase YchF [Candidatus Micrarchaeota archaeon]|nr:redox-regulated ATPase YchF [Candidatus Micrarchaeota archaeon]